MSLINLLKITNSYFADITFQVYILLRAAQNSHTYLSIYFFSTKFGVLISFLASEREANSEHEQD